MKSLPRRSSAFVGVLCLTLVGLAARADDAKEAPALALKGLDPVLLTEGKETKGQADLTVTRDGFRYQFSAAATKGKFEKDPDRYALQFKGHCAMMPDSARAQADLYTVYKERIYGFGSEGCREAFLKEPEQYVRPPQEKKKLSVVVLIFDRMELLDFAGPVETFASAGYEVHTVALTRDPITCFRVTTLKPDYTFADCPRADIVVVPGGGVGYIAGNKQVTDWVAQASAKADVTFSVCTGAFVLAKAGLLDGKEATTHWGSINALRKQFPKITVRDDRRVVDTGKIVTAAGVSSGIDGALHLVDRFSGRTAAKKAARYMEYPWQPLTEATSAGTTGSR